MHWREENTRRRRQNKVISAQRQRNEACSKKMKEAKKKCNLKKMLYIKANVIRLKEQLCMELMVRVAKARYVCVIWERVEARRMLVCEELMQRLRLARCMRSIKRRRYVLRSVVWPIDISSTVMIKQQIMKKRVNTVIKQAGRKIELNKEIVER